MPQQIEFEGVTHEFPDDFTDQDISKALGGSKTKTPMEELRGMNVGERALSGAVGGLETLGSLATVATTGLAAGVGRGLYGAATGGLEHGAKEFEAGLSAGTYEPRSTAGKVFTQGLGEGF